MDQAGWHKTDKLKIPNNIQIYFLPPYSPELNPVEKLWEYLRRHACRNQHFKNESALMDELEKKLKSLSKSAFGKLCNCSYM